MPYYMIKSTMAKVLRRTLRIILWAGLVGLAGLLLVAMAFQFWFLPRANDYRQDIAAAVGRGAGVGIEIGALSGYWRDWRPSVTLSSVVIKDPGRHDALAIAEIKTELAWKSLVLGEIRLHTLEVSRLALDVRRDVQGRWFIAGIPLSMEESHDSGLGDWLLRQDSIQITDSSVRWIDEQHDAQPLELTGVRLGLRHQFAANHIELQATPPILVAAPFALRGQVKLDHAIPLLRRNAEVDVNFPYINLAEGKKYWPMLHSLERAAGSVVATLEIEAGLVKKARARVALANVTGRLGPNLEPLQLERLSGGLEFSREPGYIELKFRELGFSAGPGVQQNNLSGELSRRVDESGSSEMGMRFDALDLAPVSALSNRLPLADSLRHRLEKMAPKGILKRLQFFMREEAGRVVKFNIDSEFENVSLNALDLFPGIGNISGSVKGDQITGNVVLRGRQGWVDLPRVLPTSVALDQLDARVQWKRQDGVLQINLQEVSLANADFAGNVGGSFYHRPGTNGRADLTAALTRAKVAAVWRYIPLIVPETVRAWLQRALVEGGANQVALVLRGDLADFPFSHGRQGVFEVKAKVQSGTLDYAPNWPKIDDINADLLIRGGSLEINDGTGRISRANLSGVSVHIPDLGPGNPQMLIQGMGTGDTSEFLRFIGESPLERITGGFAGKISASGASKLILRLDMPLRNLHDTKVLATYMLSANKLKLPANLGDLEQLNASVRITEKGVAAQDANANFMGGPVRVEMATKEDHSLEIHAAGRAGAVNVAKLLYPPMERFVTGSADWKGTFDLGKDHIRFSVDSDLVGVGSKLPEPLGKTEAESLALKVERAPHESGLSQLRAQIGGRMLVRYLSPAEDISDIKAGEVVFGSGAGELEQGGVRVSGRVPVLDADGWRSLTASAPTAPPSPTVTGSKQGLSALPVILQGLRIDRLRLFSRDFSDLTLTGRRTLGAVQLAVESKPVSGDIGWKDTGGGQLTLKLARLFLGPSTQSPVVAGSAADPLPAVDALIQDFRMGEREFGKLTLSAIPEGRQWRLRQLELKSPDGTAQVQGTYDLSMRVPRTSLEVNVEAADAGNYLARLKMPPGIKRGKAKLSGSVQWSGAPYALDLQSLTGKLVLDVKQGQFVKVDPGAGKLLGVLSLQALPRRLTLDFRDVFSEGFAFNQITATSDIGAGVATTQDFKMRGPAAVVEIKGSADLVRETQNLKVRVLPGLSDSLTVAGAIVNPAVGLAAYLAQKVLKDPVDKLFSREYDVTGTWADPTVSTKIKPSPPSNSRR